MSNITDFDAFLRDIGVGNAKIDVGLNPLLIDLVVLTVVHVAIQMDCEPEFELNLQNIVGSKGDDGRVVYPKLSFAVRGCTSALHISVIPLFAENATIHALWDKSITDTRKLTTLHLNPKQYATSSPIPTSTSAAGSKGLISQIRSVLFAPLMDERQQVRLHTLPDPLLVLVMTFLTPKEVCRSGRVSVRLHGLYREETIWRPRVAAILADLRGTLDQKRLRRRSRWGHGAQSVGAVMVPPSAVLADGWAEGRSGYEVYRAAAREIKVRKGDGLMGDCGGRERDGLLLFHFVQI